MQHVVIKFVRFVPESDSFAAEIVHRAGDPEEMFEELGRDIFVNRICARQLQSDIRIMFRQNIPIQLVPSLCSR